MRIPLLLLAISDSHGGLWCKLNREDKKEGARFQTLLSFSFDVLMAFGQDTDSQQIKLIDSTVYLKTLKTETIINELLKKNISKYLTMQFN